MQARLPELRGLPRERLFPSGSGGPLWSRRAVPSSFTNISSFHKPTGVFSTYTKGHAAGATLGPEPRPTEPFSVALGPRGLAAETTGRAGRGETQLSLSHRKEMAGAAFTIFFGHTAWHAGS